MSVEDVVMIAVTICALVFVFVCICVVCDGHLVPAVETIIDEFDVPEEIAAVTLIAFGSSSPEIMLNTVSAYKGSGALSMPAVLGSAIIAFGLIPPLCVLGTSEENIDLETRPILRETFCFIMGLCYFTKIVADGSTNLVESLLLLSMYMAYVLVIMVTYYCYKNSDHVPQHHTHNFHPIPSSISDEEKQSNPLVEVVSMGVIWERNNESIESKKYVDGSQSMSALGEISSKRCMIEKSCHAIFDFVSRPVVILFSYTIPALYDAAFCAHQSLPPVNKEFSASEVNCGHSPYCCHTNKVTLFRALMVVLTCIVYVCAFASIVVSLCGIITQRVGLDQTTVGATLVAFGAQLPDCVSSISLARGGYFNGAMANAIGSQVISITLGVSLPASVHCFYSDTKIFEIVQESDDSIKFLLGLTYLIVLGYCFFTLPLMSFLRNGRVLKSTSISRKGAYVLFALFIMVMGIYITFND